MQHGPSWAPSSHRRTWVPGTPAPPPPFRALGGLSQLLGLPRKSSVLRGAAFTYHLPKVGQPCMLASNQSVPQRAGPGRADQAEGRGWLCCGRCLAHRPLQVQRAPTAWTLTAPSCPPSHEQPHCSVCRPQGISSVQEAKRSNSPLHPSLFATQQGEAAAAPGQLPALATVLEALPLGLATCCSPQGHMGALLPHSCCSTAHFFLGSILK